MLENWLSCSLQRVACGSESLQQDIHQQKQCSFEGSWRDAEM